MLASIVDDTECSFLSDMFRKKRSLYNVLARRQGLWNINATMCQQYLKAEQTHCWVQMFRKRNRMTSRRAQSCWVLIVPNHKIDFLNRYKFGFYTIAIRTRTYSRTRSPQFMDRAWGSWLIPKTERETAWMWCCFQPGDAAHINRLCFKVLICLISTILAKWHYKQRVGKS